MSQSILERLKAAAQIPQMAEAWEEFENALAEIDTADITLLPALYQCFCDEAVILPLMWQLLHLIEAFEEEASLLGLIAQTPYLQEHAPNWLAILWTRVLNSTEVRTRLQHEIFPLFPDLSAIQTYLFSEGRLEAQARDLF